MVGKHLEMAKTLKTAQIIAEGELVFLSHDTNNLLLDNLYFINSSN